MVRLVKSILPQAKGNAALTPIERAPKPIDPGNVRAPLLMNTAAARSEAKPNPVERAETPRYSTSAIHELLTKAYGASELRRLCRDYFPPVVAELGEGSSLNTIADQLVEYCERQSMFEQLLALVEQRVPARWAEYRDRVRG
jgi:Effector-associated domain 7